MTIVQSYYHSMFILKLAVEMPAPSAAISEICGS